MATIPISGAADTLALNLAGTKLYAVLPGPVSVSVVDTGSLTELTTIPVGSSTPGVIRCNPVDGLLWVANPGDNVCYVIDPSTDTVAHTYSLTLGGEQDVAFSPDGLTVYVFGSVGIAYADATTGVVSAAYVESWPGNPRQVNINPAGTKLYLLTQDGSVTEWDIASHSVTATWSDGYGSAQWQDLSVSGASLWVNTDAGALVAMDTTTGTPTTITPPGAVGLGPGGVAMDPGGIYAYVGDFAGSQVFTMAVTPPSVVLPTALPAGAYPGELIAAHDGSVVYVADIVASDLYTIPGGVPGFVELSGTGSITIDTGTATLTPLAIPPKEVTTFVLAGHPPASGYGAVLLPTPPTPEPGPFGNHEYEVVVCDRYGIAYGVIGNAVVTQIDYELDGIGSASIDFPIMDHAAAALLPMTVLPGVREIQIWRDQALIFWGWPTDATWDNVQVHLTVPGLLWPLSTRELGPAAIHLMTNPQFEQGLDGWSAVDCFAAPTTTTKVLGTQAAALLQLTAGADAFLRTTVVVDLTAEVAGFAFALAAWFYIDTAYTYSGPALDNRGLFWQDDLGNYGFAQIDASAPTDAWTRIEVTANGGGPAFIAQPGRVTTYDIRLYCPGGSIVWDDVMLSVYENVSSPPPSPPTTAWDVTDICEALVASAQSAVWSKSDLAFAFYGAATGVMLNRVYDISTSQVILDALNEFPSIGACDFEMTWDDTGHFRGFRVYGPAKGSIKWNAVIDISVNQTTTAGGAVSGSQVGTTQRVLGQGSTGPANDTGYAQFASYLGGRVVTDGVTIIGFAGVSSATANFTSDDLGENIYSLEGALPPGTYITSIVSATAVLTNNPALLTLADQTIGVGGITVDRSSSALPDQPISTLQGTATGLLIQQMKSQALPAPRLRADGPNGLFGLITVGDVVPVSADFGWLQMEPQLMRIAKLTLYPQTEELAPTLMPVNALPSGS